MSENTEKVSKSKQIATILKDKGIDTPASEIVALVPGASVALVNNVKFRIRKNKTERAEARKGRKRRGEPAPETAKTTVQNEYDQMLAVKQFATTVGGLDNLTALIGKMKALAA